MRSYWRESSGGLRTWLGDWSISPMRKGWGSWAWWAWRRLRGDPINAYKFLKGGCQEGGARLFSGVSSDMTRGNRHKQMHSRFHLTWGRTTLLWGWWSPGTDCPGRLWILLLWRYSKPSWTRASSTCSGWPCFGRGRWSRRSTEVPFNPYYSVFMIVSTVELPGSFLSYSLKKALSQKNPLCFPLVASHKLVLNRTKLDNQTSYYFRERNFELGQGKKSPKTQ